VPLVLHGGSGTPDDQIQNAVKHGICKLNIYADCRIAMAKGLQRSAKSQTREDPMANEIFGPIKEELVKVVEQKIKLLFAENRV
jgi:fructose-bisphosphate aldolase class II